MATKANVIFSSCLPPSHSPYSGSKHSPGFGLNWKRNTESDRFSKCVVFTGWQSVMPVANKDNLSLLPEESGGEGENDALDGLQKDLNILPKPLSINDLSYSPTDASKFRVAYKGAPGSLSEDAALKAYPQCETVPCKQIEAAFKAVELWLANKAVIPIESSVGGSLHRNYDLLLRNRLHIVGEVQMAVKLCLLGLPGVRMEELKRVLSHSQALSQCEINLGKLGVVKENVDDTAAAAQLVVSNKLKDTGAIASAQAAKIYGLSILADRFEDDPHNNITRFLILSREPVIPRNDRLFKTSIVFTLEEGSGMLFKALAVFALRNINLTKIESRPQRYQPLRAVDDSDNGIIKYFDYLFYIDFEASMAEPRAQNALGHLQEFATFLRVLGCYPVDTSV